MTTMDIARKLVELCRQGRNEEALDTLYADDAVSVEAMAMSDAPPEVKGLAAIKAKGEWWMNNHEIHSSSVTGPWPHERSRRPAGGCNRSRHTDPNRVRAARRVDRRRSPDRESPADPGP